VPRRRTIPAAGQDSQEGIDFIPPSGPAATIPTTRDGARITRRLRWHDFLHVCNCS
jgi:hypothetical protein